LPLFEASKINLKRKNELVWRHYRNRSRIRAETL
jgi:hypothetical protein